MNNILDNQISWINGHWIKHNEPQLPINDRGLTLSDGIFETILIMNNQPILLNAHLDRWNESAILLGMAKPPTKDHILSLIKEAINKNPLAQGSAVLRLNWSRGDNNGRGIKLSSANAKSSSHRFWLTLRAYKPSFKPITTMISKLEQRNANSKINQCKTFAYTQSIQARREANIAGFDDALLLSTNGEIACGTTSNLIVKRRDKWLTPHISSGCLPGIMRQQGLNSGILKEAKISPEPEPKDQWLLINSLSCHSIIKVNTKSFEEYEASKILWTSLTKS
ncbi:MULTISPECIES: aminotransferase class IV [Prochlorococcus]|uniref:4-amino-4-deoxychorismate lyase related type IV aminotransferase n=2 Tax=Prochlorococcus marinus TaxID=1219 RepID=Q7V9H6_PROMA|nr:MULTISPECIES: aminotransferase class IV [Prochlorococcus]KGG19930.1 Aminodeoxychorismate lyase [Prochlorococcus marinus str. SS2]AAQ00901.1 4-amino-4-deoxychorismate lyase related type IV aminotransferase [Prochlorococcus marinus subsp. marinus str. CCMP1375]KGG23850.1 Aminodeoxychorismate lyase [Prochlorococcus marinus str. SS35]KGG31890.1 Aminodeoxychorismate lyase [Prochlorococcus marinus str. SS51]KGG35945.1 Aminodeoxychorismate lyase [Prochlorococcus sp. SS52]